MRSLAIAIFMLLPLVATANPSILIEAQYPGADAQTMMETVVVPIETQLRGCEGVARMRSLAFSGRALIRLDLDAKADLFKVRQLAQERLALAQATLPHLVALRGIVMHAATDDAFVIVALRPGDGADLLAVGTLARGTLRPALLKTPDIAGVEIIGDPTEEIQFRLDPNKLHLVDLTPAEITSALKNARKDKVGLKDLHKIVVSKREGKAILLSDIGEVVARDRREDLTGAARYMKDGVHESDAVLLIVRFTPGNTQGALDLIDKRLAELGKKLPKGVVIERELFAADDTTVVLRLPVDTPLDRRQTTVRGTIEAMRDMPARSAFWIIQGDDESNLLYVKGDGTLRTALRKDLAQRPFGSRVGKRMTPLVPWPGEGMDIAIRVRGDESKALQQTADQLLGGLRKIKGIADADNGYTLRTSWSLTVEREKCTTLGIGVQDVHDVLTLALHSKDVPPGQIGAPPLPNRLVPLDFPPNWRVSYDVAYRPEDVMKLHVRSAKGKMVPLREIVTMESRPEPMSLLRDGGEPCIVVSCNIDGRDSAEARRDIAALVKAVARKGVRVELDPPQ